VISLWRWNSWLSILILVENMNVILGLTIIQVVRCCFLTLDHWVQFWETSCEVCCGSSGTGADFFPTFLSFPLLTYSSITAPKRWGIVQTRQHSITAFTCKIEALYVTCYFGGMEQWCIKVYWVIKFIPHSDRELCSCSHLTTHMITYRLYF